jgi:hypothetical protein
MAWHQQALNPRWHNDSSNTLVQVKIIVNQFDKNQSSSSLTDSEGGYLLRCDSGQLNKKKTREIHTNTIHSYSSWLDPIKIYIANEV